MMPLHEVFREGLAGFEPGRGPRRTDDQPSGGRERIGNADAERKLGADDGEINLLAGNQLEEVVGTG